MRYNSLGTTGLRVSQLGFGCGSIGGILVRGDYPAMVQTVGRAIDLGVSYFDTAALYGRGQSEVNLGAVLRELGADVLVGSKARPAGDQIEQIGSSIIQSVEHSLRRLGRDHIDLIQLHNRVEWQRQAGQDVLGVGDLDEVQAAFQTLQQQGKVRFYGLAAPGEPGPLRQAVARGAFSSMQIPYNMLNPTAGAPAPLGFPFQDYGRLIDHAAHQGMGVIAFRILAGGALSGDAGRHPVAAPSVDPIATDRDYAADVARSQRFAFLLEQGVAGSLAEAAIRFAVSKIGVSTAILGISSLEQLEQAVAAVERGPLPAGVIAAIEQIV
jgi:aryl-alcohol dehydrogenase-like predicted oxidoreductase